MKTVCKLNKCTGCMVCADICSKAAINVRIDIEACNAEIDEQKCIDCGACNRVCQVNNPVILKKPISWYQGWSKDETTRENSASGGFATEISREFIRHGGIVFACVFEKGGFTYAVLKTQEDLTKMAGSKYIKSNPAGIYEVVRNELLAGQKVLLIGLPCHIAGIQKFLTDKLKENLYTIDLICHGSPAPQLLELFLKEHKIDMNSISGIRFRKKDYFQVESKEENDYNTVGAKGVLDSYMIGFLGGLFYTENCYECKYAQLNRVSDITIGDSWGSELPIEEQKRGISLALCQTKKGEHILKMSNIELRAVDLNLALQHNHQLEAPSIIPKQRNVFFEGIHANKGFDSMIWKTCFVKSFKQEIKKVLIRLKIYRGVKIEYGVSIRK
jgi:coenzyme F420-reducing hydrogenase beta subunit